MSKQNEISDEEFVPFLHSLGVETYKKSFEWMLSDTHFAGVFTWLYNNLDHTNALTTREEYRYAELEKRNLILSPDELESCLATIHLDYPGLCVPGDQDSLEDIKLNISMQKERLIALEKQEKVIKDLIKQNEHIKDQLTIEVTKLNLSQQRFADDEATAGKECLALAEEVDSLTDGVADTVSKALDVYANCHLDKELSKNFFIFGPMEAYRQSQALFRAHFDLFTSRWFDQRQNDSSTDKNLRSALVEAKTFDNRLSFAATAYIESKAELCGQQAKLALASMYNNVHPAQIATMTVEALTAIELLTQEEAILEQRVHSGVARLLAGRHRLARRAAASAALAQRQEVSSRLSVLLSASGAAGALDAAWCGAARAAARRAAHCALLAAGLAQLHRGAAAPAAARRESMKEIISEQEACTRTHHHCDILLHSLSSILGEQSNDVGSFVKMYADLRNKVKDLKGDVKDKYQNKEEFLEKIRSSSKPLESFIYSGSTKQANSGERTTAALSHSLRRALPAREQAAARLGGLFAAHKNGDKQNLRKLWQWFLTDQRRLLAAVKGIQANRY